MSVFGRFTYGSGTVYGPSIDIELGQPNTKNSVRLSLSDEVVTDDNYYNTANYSLSKGGVDLVTVRRVVNVVDTLSTNEVLLEVDALVEGATYTASVGNLTGRFKAVVSGSYDFVYLHTKVDSILESVPSHFDKRPESVIGSVLTAFGRSDSLIGGSDTDVPE